MEKEKKEELAGTEPEVFTRMPGRSRRREPDAGGFRFGSFGTAILLLLLLAAAGIIFYCVQTRRYVSAFFPNTVINGVDASGLSPEEVKAEIEESLSGYVLTVVTRDGQETITKEEIGLHAEFDGSLEKILATQSAGEWIMHLGSSTEIQVETMLVYDEAQLEAKLQSLSCMDSSKMREPENASVSGYQSETKSYTILPAVKGTVVVAEQVKRAIDQAVRTLETEVSLEEEGCYTRAAIEEDDEGLQAAVTELNRYVGAVVNHTFGETTETLDGDRIHTWLSVDGTAVALDENQAAAYVKELATRYNTAYQPKKLSTSYGKTVTISQGNYGWRIDEAAETEAVLAVIRAGEQQTREPAYLQTAASHGENDYGDTYVEINLTAQHLYFYKDGKLLVESDFVSGSQSRGWSTPAGAYPLTYKQRNATLRGEGYATPVSYWMPFNGGIGMHDASWRGSFGGSIYRTNGSHGCINLPASAAKLIYENISAGDPVLCYHLEGTEASSSSRGASSVKTGEAAAETTAAAATTPTTAATAPATEAPTTAAAAPETEAPATAAAETAPETSPAAETSPQETPISPAETQPAAPGGTTPAGPSVTAPADPSGTAPSAAESAPESTAPAGPSVGTEGQETAALETPASDTTPAGPSVTGPSVTSGNDSTGFGPGFVPETPETEEEEPEIGPGF